MDQKDEWAGQPLPFQRETVLDTEFTDADLEAYLDEMLDPEDAADAYPRIQASSVHEGSARESRTTPSEPTGH